MIRKRIILIVLCILVLMVIPAQAAQTRAISATPKLIFNGTTASCEVTVSSLGKNISVELELWYGNTLIDAWTKSGTSIVTISENCTVVRGRTYTLVASGTCGEESFSGVSITKTCP